MCRNFLGRGWKVSKRRRFTSVGRPTIVCLLLSLGTVLLAGFIIPPRCTAQDRRRILNSPGLVINSDAPTAATQVLTYSPDGKFLFAAGDDKVVRMWPVRNGRLARDELRTLRWATWREQRGMIYAMDVYSPEGEGPQLIAVAGLGVRNSAITVIDVNTGEVVRGFNSRKGAGDVVSALAFDPDGKRIAFGGYKGSVWLWNFESKDEGDLVCVGNHVHEKEPNNIIRCVTFLNEDTLLTVAKSDGTVRRWNLLANPPRSNELTKLSLRALVDVVVSPDKRWLAASGREWKEPDYKPMVELQSLDGKDPRRISFGTGQFPSRLAFDADAAKLAIAVDIVPRNNAATWASVENRVFLYDLASNETTVDGLPRVSSYIDALAVSPSGDCLAVAGGDDFELRTWDIEKGKEREVVRSRGSALWQVALSSDDRYLGFRDRRDASASGVNSLGAGAWRVFDLRGRGWASAAKQGGFEPVPCLDTLDGWAVVPTEDSYRWDVVNRRTKSRYALEYDQYRFGPPRCFTFLKPVDDKPVRLAVGHRFGLSVFELSHDKAPRLARIFVGHQGEVTSVAPSRDHRILISASRDQTISAWSLADWPNQAELGVAFNAKDGRLKVRAVASGSPGWEAGLSPDDEVTFFWYDGKRVEGDVEEMSRLLRDPTPGRQMYFKVKRPGQAKELEKHSTLPQRPLWRFFPTRDGEWVLWRWRDFFYDCSTHGDDLIGWQISGDVDKTPTFVRAEQFRRRFHRPDKLEKLLSEMVSQPERVAAADLAPPKVTLETSPVRGDAELEVTIRAAVQGESFAAEPHEVSLWVNDFRFHRWTAVSIPFVKTVRVPAEALRAGKNRLLAQAYSKVGVRGDSDHRLVERPTETTKQPRLFSLCVGIDRYKQPPGELRFAGKDAKGVDKAIRNQGGNKLYAKVLPAKLLDEKASRKAIIEHLKSVAKRVDPDDTFVLFLAGHGWARKTGESSFDPNSFAFVTLDFDLRRPVATGVSFAGTEEDGSAAPDSLYELLAAIPCRKCVFLDCCYSGAGTDLIRQLTPEGVGPFILVASDKTQSSWELTPEGHGVFSTALLEAFGDRFADCDANDDGRLYPSEVTNRLQAQVPQLIETYRYLLTGLGLRPGETQQPQSFVPEDLAKWQLFGRAR